MLIRLGPGGRSHQLSSSRLAPLLIAFPVSDTRILSKIFMVTMLSLGKRLMPIDIAVDSFVVEHAFGRLSLQLATDLFRRQAVAQPGQYDS